jgi:hypothetical protein
MVQPGIQGQEKPNAEGAEARRPESKFVSILVEKNF